MDLCGGYLDKKLSKESKMTIMLIVFGFTAGYEIILYIYRNIALSSYMEIAIFTRKVFIEILYNLLITIILYPIIKRFGYKMEDIFKNKKILTRYF